MKTKPDTAPAAPVPPPASTLEIPAAVAVPPALPPGGLSVDGLSALLAAKVEAPNVKQAQKKGEKAKQTNIDLRKVHWADVKDEDIWLL